MTLSPAKFILASVLTFVVSFIVMTIVMNDVQPTHCADQQYEYRVVKEANEFIPIMEGGMMPMATNQVINNTNSTPPYQCERKDTQSKLAMFLISFFVGGLAVDRFLMGYTCIGVAKLLVPTCGIWQIIDWALILQNQLYMANGCALVQDM